MKCKHSAKKCGIIAAVCYKEKQRISRDKTHQTDHTTQEDKTMAKIYEFLADGCEEIEALTPGGSAAQSRRRRMHRFYYGKKRSNRIPQNHHSCR